MPATGGIFACGTWWPPACIRTDLLLSPVTRTEAGEVAAMLRACGIARLAARKFLSLSYGEKRLALLARALVQHPDWLLLDEVYNGLDGEYRRRIDAVLAAARAKGQSWVATAHRAMDVPAGTRFLIELSGGRIRQIKRFSTADLARLRARAGESLPRASRRGERRVPSPAAHGRMLLRLSNVDLYVGLPGRVARGQLAAAARRALGRFRRKRRRKIQFSETPVRRFGACAGRESRARRLSRRHADL